jgi:hypothetical protein
MKVIHQNQLCFVYGKNTRPPILFRRCEFCELPDIAKAYQVYYCFFRGEPDLTDEQYKLMRRDAVIFKGQPIVAGEIHNAGDKHGRKN